MDASPGIEMNRLALKRILASLVAMAGLAGRWQSPSPLRGGVRGGGDIQIPPPGELRSPTSPQGGGWALTVLPRSIRLAILSILRPAEAATRRQVVALAPSLPPAALPARAAAGTRPAVLHGRPAILRGRTGTGIIMPAASRAAFAPAAPSAYASFRMLDPLRSPFRHRRRWVRQVAMPRISMPGFSQPAPLVVRAPTAPSDPVDAAPIGRRLAALGRALDNLPARARRFALWRARARGLRAEGRTVRISPLRPGRPPGGRLFTYDPDRPRRKRIREVDEVLAHAHALACEALRPPDGS